MSYCLNFKSVQTEFVFVVIAIFFVFCGIHISYSIHPMLRLHPQVYGLGDKKASYPVNLLHTQVNVTRITMIKYFLVVTLSMNEHE